MEVTEIVILKITGDICKDNEMSWAWRIEVLSFKMAAIFPIKVSVNWKFTKLLFKLINVILFSSSITNSVFDKLNAHLIRPHFCYRSSVWQKYVQEYYISMRHHYENATISCVEVRGTHFVWDCINVFCICVFTGVRILTDNKWCQIINICQNFSSFKILLED